MNNSSVLCGLIGKRVQFPCVPDTVTSGGGHMPLRKREGDLSEGSKSGDLPKDAEKLPRREIPEDFRGFFAEIFIYKEDAG